MNKEFKTQIGLEIHVQLKTKSKMFCGCDNDAQGKEPNTVICPICMGMPGTLPVPNKTAIEMTIKTGLALGSKIPKISKFDRKHYFYPDLPKGYQISQYDMPFCLGGKTGLKEIRLNRVHLEEDAGKLLHPEGSKHSIVDLNRAGTPLMEIVTEPDIESPTEAKEFLKELQIILRHLGVSDADMEKGHLRCDANISVSHLSSVVGRQTTNDKRQTNMSEIVEIKNLNSFKFVEKALIYEEKRLMDEYPNWPEKKKKVTRGFDSKAAITFVQREKEEAKDYRYFPEPDIPPFIANDLFIGKIRSNLSVLPSQKKNELISSGISQNEAGIIIKNAWMSQVIMKAEKLDRKVKERLSRIVVHEKKAENFPVDFLISLAQKAEDKSFSSDKIRKILDSGDINLVLGEKTGSGKISQIVDEVLSTNSDVVAKYKSGKTQVIGFLIGQVVKKSHGEVEPSTARDEIIKKIGG